MPSKPLLTDREKAFCLDVGFSHWQYAVLRDRILREAEEHDGRFPKAYVRSFFRLDATQAVKLFDFLVAEGRLVNLDKDLKEQKKPDLLTAHPEDEMDIDKTTHAA